MCIQYNINRIYSHRDSYNIFGVCVSNIILIEYIRGMCIQYNINRMNEYIRSFYQRNIEFMHFIDVLFQYIYVPY